jgi:hypothetical protein
VTFLPGQDECPLNNMLQFANIPRSRMLPQNG